MPETRAFIGARGGADRERRMLRARPMRAIPSSTSRVVSSCCGTIGWGTVRAVGSAYTAAPGNWAPVSHPQPNPWKELSQLTPAGEQIAQFGGKKAAQIQQPIANQNGGYLKSFLDNPW